MATPTVEYVFGPVFEVTFQYEGSDVCFTVRCPGILPGGVVAFAKEVAEHDYPAVRLAGFVRVGEGWTAVVDGQPWRGAYPTREECQRRTEEHLRYMADTMTWGYAPSDCDYDQEEPDEVFTGESYPY